jgi:alginate O-acetyltransferase complex protein AlgJ
MSDFVEPEVRHFDARRAAHDRKFIEGKDGWLFLDNDLNNVVAQHRGELLLSEEQLERWSDGLERRAAWQRSRGGTYLFLIVPDKHAIYPEYLPPAVVPGPVRPVLQLLDRLRARETTARVVYPVEELHAAKRSHQVYSATDTHWNAYGVFTVYDRIMEELGTLNPVRRVTREEITIRERMNAGDLGLKVQPERKSTYAYFNTRHREGRRQWDNGVRGFGRTIEFACPEAPGTTCVVFGDSATARLSTLLAESFRKVVLHYSTQVDQELAERAEADIVLSVLTERRMVDERAVPAD